MLVGQQHRMELESKEIKSSIKAPNSFLLYQTKRRNDSNGQEVSSSQLLAEWNLMSNEQKTEFQNQSQCIQFTLDIDNRPHFIHGSRLPKIVVPRAPSSMLIPNDHASPTNTTTDQLYNHHAHPQQHHYQPHHYQHSHHQLSDLLLHHPLEKSFFYHPTTTTTSAAATAEAAALESLSLKQHHIVQDKNEGNLRKKYGTLPEKVKRPPNAYLLFNRDMRRQLKHVNQGLTSGEISKSISSKWKQLSPVQKEYYIGEEIKLKQLHNKQHSNFIYTRRSKAEMREADSLKKLQKSSSSSSVTTTNTTERKKRKGSPKPTTTTTDMVVVVGRDPRGRKKKKPDASLPKHPMSGYLHFAKEMRPIMKKKCPDARLVEISKQIGSQWRSMTEKELAPWQEIANRDKQRYAQEMKDRILYHSNSLDEDDEENKSRTSTVQDTLDSHTIAAVAQMVNRNTTFQ
ncbi:hypothetical protein INT47_000748 [Mucor saturninus]|uniref:HMG box domain-containing protein n=1 Tax=Mucor saturninus TaxID=64648 RepID=A0A8H7UYI5_9FUNG|nr:hypothetical protein INT47_000748 [Mucor saturninus]